MVLDIGDIVFGMFVCIMFIVFVGVSGVVDIECEVEFGQFIYLKGVMLLNGYLGNKYVQYFLLILLVNIVLEQLYGYIDGDSVFFGELVVFIFVLIEIFCL